MCDLTELDLAIEFEYRHQILGRESAACKGIQRSSQRADALIRQRESHGMRMSAKLCEQRPASGRLKRFQQMECMDRASRSVCLPGFAITRNHQRGTAS